MVTAIVTQLSAQFSNAIVLLNTVWQVAAPYNLGRKARSAVFGISSFSLICTAADSAILCLSTAVC